MPGKSLRLTWLVPVAMAVVVCLATGCAVAAPAAPTATAAPTAKPTTEPLDLLILYTSDTGGIAESTAAVGG